MMDFGHAFDHALGGARITRAGWNGKGLALEVQWPDEKSKMTLPYLYIEYPDGRRCPWLASQTDLFERDWMIAP